MGFQVKGVCSASQQLFEQGINPVMTTSMNIGVTPETALTSPPVAKSAPLIGAETNFVPDIKEVMDDYLKHSFDFICIPLVHPRYKRNLLTKKDRDEPFTRSDMLLTNRQWSSFVVGKTSPWLRFDSPSAKVRENSVLVFEQELDWAQHLGVQATIVPTPSKDCFNLARCISAKISTLRHMEMYVRIPLISKKQQVKAVLKMDEDDVLED